MSVIRRPLSGNMLRDYWRRRNMQMIGELRRRYLMTIRELRLIRRRRANQRRLLRSLEEQRSQLIDDNMQWWLSQVAEAVHMYHTMNDMGPVRRLFYEGTIFSLQRRIEEMRRDFLAAQSSLPRVFLPIPMEAVLHKVHIKSSCRVRASQTVIYLSN